MAKEISEAVVKAAAAAMGRKGGSARVPKGYSFLGKKELSRIGKAAAKARWGKVKADKAKAEEAK